MVKVKKPTPVLSAKAAPSKKSDKKTVLKKTKIVKKSVPKENVVPKATKKTTLLNGKTKTSGKVQKQKAQKDLSKKPQVAEKLQKKLPEHEVAGMEALAAPFNAQLFQQMLDTPTIAKIAHSLKALCEHEVAQKKSVLFSDFHYFLNVSCFKIPDCPKRMVKLNLKHSLINKQDDDVLLVVPDLQRGARVDYEPTIQHYTDLLQQHGLLESGYRFTIMPFNQLKKEYKSFEALRKLAASYDYFLSEGRIVGHVVSCVGSTFQKPRTTFHAVKLEKPEKFKQNLERALKRTAYRQLERGNLSSIPLGNQHFTGEQLAENVLEVVEQLKSIYPGGWENIRNMYLRIDITGTPALPIYLSNCQPPEKTPYVVGPREKRMLKLKREANAVLKNFNLDKKADVLRLNPAQVEQKQQLHDMRQLMWQAKQAKLAPATERKRKVKLDTADKSEANLAAKKVKKQPIVKVVEEEEQDSQAKKAKIPKVEKASSLKKPVLAKKGLKKQKK